MFASGGSLAAVLGMGVASAPGVGVTASAMAVDVTTFLAAATRLVAHTAAYYGYDSEDPSERLFSTMVLSQAIDPAGSGRDFVVEKQATMLAFNQVMRDLARKGSLESLGGSAIVSAMKSLFSAMGVRLASRKLAQIVPVAGNRGECWPERRAHAHHRGHGRPSVPGAFPGGALAATCKRAARRRTSCHQPGLRS